MENETTKDWIQQIIDVKFDDLVRKAIAKEPLKYKDKKQFVEQAIVEKYQREFKK